MVIFQKKNYKSNFYIQEMKCNRVSKSLLKAIGIPVMT